MQIAEAIKEYCQKPRPTGFLVATNEYGNWVIKVDFLNDENEQDQTQFDVKPHHFDYGIGKCDKLVELWKEFCKDNSFKQNSVIKIQLVGGWE